MNATAGAAIEKALAEGRSALVGYLPAGFPSYDGAIMAIRAMVEGGVDVVEVGLPYSDPVMDGPTIQVASDQALRGGIRTVDVLRTVEAVTGFGVPALVMTYWNPIERYGVDRFARDLAAAGGAGLITPDLIPEEAEPWVAAADEHGLDKVFLVAPSSGDERLRLTVRACRGFVYAASLMGVTGARDSVSQGAPRLVERTREAIREEFGTGHALPVGVGLGVSNGDQAAEVAGYADAVIVGSAFIRRILDADDEASALAALSALAADLAEGVRRRS